MIVIAHNSSDIKREVAVYNYYTKYHLISFGKNAVKHRRSYKNLEFTLKLLVHRGYLRKLSVYTSRKYLETASLRRITCF